MNSRAVNDQQRSWEAYRDAGCPCSVCGIPTNPKWDGSVSKSRCLAASVVQCNKHFCPEHQHPESHHCYDWLHLREVFRLGYRRFRVDDKNMRIGCLGIYLARSEGDAVRQGVAAQCREANLEGQKVTMIMDDHVVTESGDIYPAVYEL